MADIGNGVHIEFYSSGGRFRAQRYRWRVKSTGNGEALAQSSEGYYHKDDCVLCAEQVLGMARLNQMQQMYLW